MIPRAGVVGAMLALLLAGCGGESYKTAPVSGRVTLDNKPLAKASIMFVPAVAQGEKVTVPSSAGLTDDDGRYTLVLNSGSKSNGAVVGKHKVIILLTPAVAEGDTKPTFHQQLPIQYNRNTKLECEVPASGRDDANFDLKSKP